MVSLLARDSGTVGESDGHQQHRFVSLLSSLALLPLLVLAAGACGRGGQGAVFVRVSAVATVPTVERLHVRVKLGGVAATDEVLVPINGASIPPEKTFQLRFDRGRSGAVDLEVTADTSCGPLQAVGQGQLTAGSESEVKVVLPGCMELPDMSSPVDIAARDAAGDAITALPDLALPDLALPDLALPDLGTPDTAAPVDAALDVAALPDLASADKAVPVDAALAPDLTALPDLTFADKAVPVDATVIPDQRVSDLLAPGDGGMVAVTACRALDVPYTTYLLQNNLSGGAVTPDCLKITAQHVTLDCVGRSIINASLQNVPAITVLADYGTVRNCVVAASAEGQGVGGYGISVQANFALIEKNVAQDSFWGIAVGGNSNVVQNNVAQRNGKAISVGGADNVIKNNLCKDNNLHQSWALSIWVGQRNKLRNNKTYGSGYAYVIYDGDDTEIMSCGVLTGTQYVYGSPTSTGITMPACVPDCTWTGDVCN